MTLRRGLILAGVLVALDQGTKWVVGLRIPHVSNQGFVFGLGPNIGSWIFLLLTGIIVFDAVKRGMGSADIFILAGGVGNIVDRMIRGAVIDWIHVTPVWFNLGDVWITLGVIWTFLLYLKTTRFWSSINRRASS